MIKAGDIPGALAYLERAKQLADKSLGDTNPLTQAVATTRAEALAAGGRLAEARVQYDAVLAIEQKTLSGLLAATLASRMTTELGAKDWPAAATFAQRAIDTVEASAARIRPICGGRSRGWATPTSSSATAPTRSRCSSARSRSPRRRRSGRASSRRCGNCSRTSTNGDASRGIAPGRTSDPRGVRVDRLMRVGIVVAVLAALASFAGADDTLQNDGFQSGDMALAQEGFDMGEIAASRFIAPDATRQLLKVQLIFGGAAGSATVTLQTWDDSAGTTDPGTMLSMDDFQLVGSDSAPAGDGRFQARTYRAAGVSRRHPVPAGWPAICYARQRQHDSDRQELHLRG